MYKRILETISQPVELRWEKCFSKHRYQRRLTG